MEMAFLLLSQKKVKIICSQITEKLAVRSVEGKFAHAHLVGEGKITLSEGTVIKIDSFEDNWQFTSYSAKGEKTLGTNIHFQVISHSTSNLSTNGMVPL
jgi:hypothetical protein